MGLARRSPVPGRSSAPAVRAWRAATAFRTFALALATGMILADGRFTESAPILTAVCLIAGVTSALEWGSLARSAPWIPVAESALVAIVVTTATGHPGLLPYLSVPCVVAGVRHGWITTVNSSLVGVAAVIAAVAADGSGASVDRVAQSFPWIMIGLGVGLLASWQSRSTRSLVARQAPHAAAHQLMARIHELAKSGTLGLDTASLTIELDAAMRAATGCARSVVFVVGADDSIRPLNGGDDSERLADEIRRDDAERTPGTAVVPLHGAEQILGYCVLVGVPRWTHDLDERALEVADEFALRLDTAVLFDDVRGLATSQERNRIAREMHDGVAQEIVGLGFLVDEIESVSNHAETRMLASTLRSEITRLVSEIRFSIFDLRHEITDGRLAASLADYAREVGDATGLRVHLSLAESGPPLSPRHATEVLRVAQEAIGNARKHAGADNLWVSLDSDGNDLRLEVADDGVGNAGPRERHWGLQGMSERAAAVGAALDVAPRPGGGTLVTLRSPATAPHEGERAHEHHRLAR